MNWKFWKKEKEQTEPEGKVVIGMIMLNDEHSYQFETLSQKLKTQYHHQPFDIGGDNQNGVFKVNNNLVSIYMMPVPVPKGDIETTAQYAYNWPTVLEDVMNHKSHLIVTVMGPVMIDSYKLFTQVVSSLLQASNAIGIYLGLQSLIIPTKDYLEQADTMDENNLPLNLWIYFGLARTDDGNVGYTYGLNEFGKKELEILHSERTPDDIRDFLFNISHCVLDNNIEFKSGETCGLSADERVMITLSKGKMLEGETFKLDY